MIERKNIVPLSGTFMMVGLLGASISMYLTNADSASVQLPLRWGATFTFFFVLMVIASLISMTYAPSGFTKN